MSSPAQITPIEIIRIDSNYVYRIVAHGCVTYSGAGVWLNHIRLQLDRKQQPEVRTHQGIKNTPSQTVRVEIDQS